MIEERISRKEIFKGDVVSLCVDKVMLPNKKVATREVVNHRGAVCIAPVTRDNELVFIKQFRYSCNKIFLELPAGKLEAKDSSLLECAKRELFEETGIIGKDYIALGKIYTSPGFCSEIIYIFTCIVDRYENPHPDEDEFIEVIKLPFEKAKSMILAGEIEDAKTQSAILKLILKGKI